jgi:hypothetical protein
LDSEASIKACRRFRCLFYLVCLSLIWIAFAVPPASGQAKTDIRANYYILDDQTRPAVAADAAGNMVIVWTSDREDGDLTGVFARLFNKGGSPKGGEIQVDESYFDRQENPAVAMATNGEFVVAWVTSGVEGGGAGDVMARLYDKSGRPLTGEFQVNTYILDYQGEPAVVMDKDGNFIVAWQSWKQDGDSFGVYARRFRADGSPLAAEFPVNTYNTTDQFHPAIASDADGDFVIAWTSFGQDGDQTGIFAQRFSKNGTRAGTEFRINPRPLGPQERPGVAMGQNGNFVVCWQSYEFTQDSYDIQARAFDEAGSPLGNDWVVNTYRKGYQIHPDIAADGQDHFLIAWESWAQDGDSFGVFAAVFDSRGLTLADEFQANAAPAGSQERPRGFLTEKSHFGIVWQSSLKGDYGWDIFFRIFETTTPAFRGSTRLGTKRLLSHSPS